MVDWLAHPARGITNLRKALMPHKVEPHEFFIRASFALDVAR
jgi:hypothetical protein